MPMHRLSRALACVSIAAVLAVGCSLVKPGAEPDAALSSIGTGMDKEQLAELLAPPRIALKVMIATRPIDEPALRDLAWSVADEHVIDPDRRLRLEANGLRVAVVDGTLPPEVEEILSPDAPQGERIDPIYIAVPEGHATPIQLGPDEPVERKTLFLSLGGGAVGRDYENPRPAIRVSASRSGGSVSLRIVPEIHHGAEQIRFAPAENVGPFEPEQFVMREGQQEESFRDLAASISLSPGQILMIGCWPDRPGSLGHFLFTKNEPKSDRQLQSVVFLWASPTGATEIPWVGPIAPPNSLREVEPSELGVDRP
ncbi:hypothetical protein [Tautonia sociabilis]|uniref:Uncharacterized protein n=1 Tax=Tautonia sociabilis TaxID=2080755 RepID=A0A432MPQ0_9BACT|nr:hypothetical protein [Tautonia sociabilis]RUL89310.1 hypothetical protein TsocGM_02520 [Tautonia sociabilis]